VQRAFARFALGADPVAAHSGCSASLPATATDPCHAPDTQQPRCEGWRGHAPRPLHQQLVDVELAPAAALLPAAILPLVRTGELRTCRCCQHPRRGSQALQARKRWDASGAPASRSASWRTWRKASTGARPPRLRAAAAAKRVGDSQTSTLALPSTQEGTRRHVGRPCQAPPEATQCSQAYKQRLGYARRKQTQIKLFAAC
jgi:hypothetical protein